MFPSVWGQGRFIILVFTGCILKLPTFKVDPEIIQAPSEMECLKKTSEEPNNVKLLCTVPAQILHHFQIQSFTSLRALHFRSEWVFWAHAQWTNLDSLDGAGAVKSTPATWSIALAWLCLFSGLSELEASWLLQHRPTQAAMGWTRSTPWYFQDIVLILIENLGKSCRTRWRGWEYISGFYHGF